MRNSYEGNTIEHGDECVKSAQQKLCILLIKSMSLPTDTCECPHNVPFQIVNAYLCIFQNILTLVPRLKEED